MSYLKFISVGLVLTLCACTGAKRDVLIVPIHKTTKEGVGDYIGAIKFYDSDQGLAIHPRLVDLTPGGHGFHIHVAPDCGPKNGVPAGAAGSHYDPEESKIHKGPHGFGHKGDLPILQVDSKGQAHEIMYAPRLKVQEIRGHSIMIHEGGDNFSDSPKPLGGGGARIACGVIPLESR